VRGGGAGLSVRTPRGTAALRVLVPAGEPIAIVALGHGAGGGVDAPDLAAVTAALLAAGAAVGLVTQPYRVAGRKLPGPAAALDEAWLAAVEALRGHLDRPALPLVTGGRSSGARVACRTAAATRSAGLVALAFPLVPPPRRTRPAPENGDARDGAARVGAARAPASRAGELATGLSAAPVLVVQGDADPFGGAEDMVAALGPAPGLTLHAVPGADHALRAGRPRRVPDDVPAAVTAAVRDWVTGGGIGRR
jgi:predicted alpha/beta-hydrolase family hydrolase